MNKLGINLLDGYLPYKEALELFADIGFDSFFTPKLNNIEEIARLGAVKGLYYECIHAPFADINFLWTDSGERGNIIFSLLKDTLLDCYRFGVPKMILHLGSKRPPTITDLGVSRIDELVDIAINKNVKIAIENLRTYGNIGSMLERYDSCENVGFCYDTGHEACFTQRSDFLRLYGDRLCFTHFADNMLEYDKDLHMIPFDGKIDFARIAEKLKALNYGETLTLEVLPRAGVPVDYSLMSAREFYERAYKAIKKIRGMML